MNYKSYAADGGFASSAEAWNGRLVVATIIAAILLNAWLRLHFGH